LATLTSNVRPHGAAIAPLGLTFTIFKDVAQNAPSQTPTIWCGGKRHFSTGLSLSGGHSDPLLFSTDFFTDPHYYMYFNASAFCGLLL